MRISDWSSDVCSSDLYKATERDDTPFWRHCAQLQLPEHATRKVALFRASGQIVRENEELFTEGSWLQVMLGQGIEPQRYHPSADAISAAQLDGFLQGIRSTESGRASCRERVCQDV